MANELKTLVEVIRSKVESLKKKWKKKKTTMTYIKMDKTASVRLEIRSRKAQQIIDRILKTAGKKSLS